MARRGRKSNAEVLVDVVALMPWWACLGMALASFLFFRAMSAPPEVTAIQPSQVGQLMLGAMVAGVAMAGQYVAPFICLVGAIVSFVRRRKREELVATAAATGINSGPGSIAGMTWREFELLVGESFRLQGYQVSESGGGGSDGGVDLRLRRGKETFLVQCKQWRATRVGVDVVRELYGVMAAEGSTGGFVVTSGQFTSDAQAFSAGRNIKLVDGNRLYGLIQQARDSRGAGAPAAAVSTAQIPEPGRASAPSCPKCSAQMVLRTARKGANAGGEFWGCTRYPACKGTR
jgi:restriction system protein